MQVLAYLAILIYLAQNSDGSWADDAMLCIPSMQGVQNDFHAPYSRRSSLPVSSFPDHTPRY